MIFNENIENLSCKTCKSNSDDVSYDGSDEKSVSSKRGDSDYDTLFDSSWAQREAYRIAMRKPRPMLTVKTGKWSDHRYRDVDFLDYDGFNVNGSDTDTSYATEEWEGNNHLKKKFWHSERFVEKVTHKVLIEGEPLDEVLPERKKKKQRFQFLQLWLRKQVEEQERKKYNNNESE